MKAYIKKFRSVFVIATSLVFNLISSLLVWHPDGQAFNKSPMTVTEWICDIISIVWFLHGFVLMFVDIHLDEKKRIKEAILEASDELKEVKNTTIEISGDL